MKTKKAKSLRTVSVVFSIGGKEYVYSVRAGHKLKVGDWCLQARNDSYNQPTLIQVVALDVPVPSGYTLQSLTKLIYTVKPV